MSGVHGNAGAGFGLLFMVDYTADALECGISTAAVWYERAGADGAVVGWLPGLAPSAREWRQAARWEEQASTTCLSSWIVIQNAAEQNMPIPETTGAGQWNRIVGAKVTPLSGVKRGAKELVQTIQRQERSSRCCP
jgi:hypothetical protein